MYSRKFELGESDGHCRAPAGSRAGSRTGQEPRRQRLHALAEAYIRFRRRTGRAPVRLEAAGYTAPAHRAYLEDTRRRLDKANLSGEFSYRGVVDRDGKIAYLRSLDLLSVPAAYDEPKGMFLLEAMACGVPVVCSNASSLPEVMALAREIARVRSARNADREHPLYRLQPEGWLESQVRTQIVR